MTLTIFGVLAQWTCTCMSQHYDITACVLVEAPWENGACSLCMLSRSWRTVSDLHSSTSAPRTRLGSRTNWKKPRRGAFCHPFRKYISHLIILCQFIYRNHFPTLSDYETRFVAFEDGTWRSGYSTARIWGCCSWLRSILRTKKIGSFSMPHLKNSFKSLFTLGTIKFTYARNWKLTGR